MKFHPIFWKYFSQTKTLERKNENSSFHQFSNKSLREAWDQFKGLLQKTHSHGFRKLVQINMYIDGLRPYTRQFHDSSANAN